MTENLILTIATGDIAYGQQALNLCLSIKAQNPNQKVALIHELSAVKGIEPLCERFFDYIHIVHNNEYALPHEFAFALKTELYDIATTIAPDAAAYLYIDADCIILPKDKNAEVSHTDEWFKKFEKINFTTYCNDVYDYESKTRKRKDYTFWCDPEKLRAEWFEHYNFLPEESTAKMPQINTSLIYFKKCDEIFRYFLLSKMVWDSDKISHQKYKGAKPDELCFNVASYVMGIMPHQNPHRPIFFQFASEHCSIPYILQYYKAFGFAGQMQPAHHIIDFYNQLSHWYRQMFGVSVEFYVTREQKIFVDPNPIPLKATKKKTIYRCDEVSDSRGGIFNPDQLILSDGSVMTIMRKEKNLDAYKMKYGNTGVAHVNMLKDGVETDYDLLPVGYDESYRLEDFRLIKWHSLNSGAILCNHKLIINPKPDEREMKTCLAKIDVLEKTLTYIEIPGLPIELRKTDINWVIWIEDNWIFLVYQLSPYRLFAKSLAQAKTEWAEAKVKPVSLDFIHKDQYICNSTNPILIGDYLLMFFHTKEMAQYFHGACLIDKETKEIAYYTHNSIDIKDLDLVRGLHDKLLYISGAVYFEDTDTLRVLFNEGDHHSAWHEYNATEFIEAVKLNSPIGNEVKHDNSSALERLKEIQK